MRNPLAFASLPTLRPLSLALLGPLALFTPVACSEDSPATGSVAAGGSAAAGGGAGGPIGAGGASGGGGNAAGSGGTAGMAPAPIGWGACPDRFRDECATVKMPLDHTNPAGPEIDVFLSRRRGGGARQLWLLQGGPGASAESFYGLHDFLTAVDPQLDVYTIEHRGVGDSSRLSCENTGEKESSLSGTKIEPEEWPACRDEVVGNWGDKLAHFTTTQAAHDLALAIDRTRGEGQGVFVYGGSYGTYWANRYGVLHPTQPSGIILDAPVQPRSDLSRFDFAFDPIGRKLFAELCPKSARCQEKLGPDPLAFFDTTFAELAAGKCKKLGVDLPTWRAVFGLSLMDGNLRNWLPALVYRLHRCSAADQKAVAKLFSKVFKGGPDLPRTSKTLQLHVLLSELWATENVDAGEVEKLRDSTSFFLDSIAGVFQMQATWPRYARDPRDAEYLPSSVPTLVMGGEEDPAAPPALVGRGFRDNLLGPHQTYVEMPFGTHCVLTTSPVGEGKPSCPVQLVRAFLADPSAKLPVECAPQVLPPTFTATPEIAKEFFDADDLYD